MLRIADCVLDRVWLAVPQATEWQRIGDKIDTAMVFTGCEFVSVDETHSGWLQRLIRIGTMAPV